jgi:hypothetical protein
MSLVTTRRTKAYQISHHRFVFPLILPMSEISSCMGYQMSRLFLNDVFVFFYHRLGNTMLAQNFMTNLSTSSSQNSLKLAMLKKEIFLFCNKYAKTNYKAFKV